MQITVVVAIAANRMIGCANQLLWHIKEDLQHFKTITSGGVVIMGRKTYESIGRPLPNRRNIIITRNSEYIAEGCEVYGSVELAFEAVKNVEEVYIIGGGEIYSETLPLANKIELTVVEREYEGDTMFPEFDREEWEMVRCERHERGVNYEHPFRFETLVRRR